MVDSKKRYRRVSINTMDGRKGDYDALVDVDTDPETGTVTYRIYSQVLTDKCHAFRSSGNAALDAQHLEKKCQDMYEFDQNLRVRPAPKPGGGGPRTATLEPLRCPRCGGSGIYEDEWGYEETCPCRS